MSVDKIDKPAAIPQLMQDKYITHLMYLIWQSRVDLRKAFDLDSKEGQEQLHSWYVVSVNNKRETKGSSSIPRIIKALFSSEGVSFHSWLVSIEGYLARLLPATFCNLGKPIWYRLLAFSVRASIKRKTHPRQKSDVHQEKEQAPTPALLGVNLIGYVHTESGMGEHIRMSASAFGETNIQHGVLDFNIGVPSRQGATLQYAQRLKSNTYSVNIFHINADQMLNAYWQLGADFFKNRYNIIYPFWELSKWPKELTPVLEIMDEVWAPSKFIQAAIMEHADMWVEYMPVCVDLPKIRAYSRSEFGLPEARFLFLFSFDFFSYIERKNPFAAVKAFKKAFPIHSSNVGLVIKTMNVDIKHPNWKRMLELIDGDTRVIVINKIMDRAAVIGLHTVVDCFVSLHRSEGFGFGPAEAMFLNKPVIVTNYSGNTDYTLPDNACLVDYALIPVKDTDYLYPSEQVWADADIEHAAWYMRKLSKDSVYARDIADRGMKFIHANYSPEVIARNYAKRLKKIETGK